jgi:flagellin
MSVINTNISALQAQNSLRSTGLNLSTAMERLSSGTRINSAKDDAAGLAISTRMTASIRGISAAIRNANDGISLTQTAEGSLSQIGDNLQRIRELAVQSSNTGNSASDRAAMNNESKQLIAEIDRVASNTSYNGISLLNGTFQNQALQVGAGNGANDRISISIGSAKSNALGVGSGSSYASSTVGTAVGSTALAAGALNINGFSVGAAQADGVSNTASDTSGIAVAAAINAISAQTNVTATVGATSGYAGTSVTGNSTAILAGDVKINGVSIGPIAASTTAGGRGGQVAAAVNAISSQTGVTASFDNTSGAVSLTAADGRNISIDAINAGGSAKVTGLGSGTVLTATSATAATVSTGMDANAFSVNGVNVGAVAAGVAVTAVTAATESSVITFSALTAGQTAVVNGLTFTSTGASTAAQVAAAFAGVTSGQTAASVTTTNTVSAALGSFTGTFTAGFSTGAISGVTVTAASDTASAQVTDIATSGTGVTKVTTQGAAAVTGMTAFESKAANVATAINLLTSQTGVTASSTAGKVTLVSDGRDIKTTAATADTGITVTAAVITAATSTNSLTNRSSVTLSSTQTTGINVSGNTAAALTASGLTEASATVTTTAGAGVSSLDLTTAAGSQAALTTLDAAINTITDSRASMGAYQNRLTASISNLETTSMNLSASRSRILDTDYAKETTNLAKAQIISQAATAMLAQANQSGQSVLALLK